MKTIPVSPQRKVLGTVQLRGGFSDRNGIHTVSKAIQYDDFDERTRIILYNKFYEILELISKSITSKYGVSNHTFEELHLLVLENVYCYDITKISNRARPTFYEFIESTIKNDTYDAVLTVLEYVFSWTHTYMKVRQPFYDYDRFIQETETSGRYEEYIIDEYELFNKVFEQECVGYRFVCDRIVKIVDKIEIEEIEQACKNEFDGCREHIRKSVDFLADREAKDYKNCIKESISAVESICQIITGNSKATLGEALKELEDKGIVIHSAMKGAFSKLYGYTSDEGGVRHAEGMFISNVTFEEAKFMLVSCSAFVNYLIAQYGKTSKKIK